MVLAVDELRAFELEELRPRDEAEPITSDWLNCRALPFREPNDGRDAE